MLSFTPIIFIKNFLMLFYISGETWTFDVKVMSQEFYHCATTAQPDRQLQI
jgi:hypothetical protein